MVFCHPPKKRGVDFVFVPVRFFDIFVGLYFCVFKCAVQIDWPEKNVHWRK